MPNNNLKENILGKIESEHITPTAAWHFTVRHTLLWIPGTLVTLVGACAWAGMLFGIEHAGFEYERYIAPNKIQFLFNTMPLIWILSFLLFAAIIVHTLRLTPKGYRFNSKIVLGSSLVLSMVVGTVLYIIDMRGYKNIVIRYPVERQQKGIWSHPETGHIAGLVQVQGDMLILTDLNDKQWVLNTTFLPTTTTLAPDKVFRLIGSQIDEDNFLVCMVLPWNLSLRPTRILSQHTSLKMKVIGTSTSPHPCPMMMQR